MHDAEDYGPGHVDVRVPEDTRPPRSTGAGTRSRGEDWKLRGRAPSPAGPPRWDDEIPWKRPALLGGAFGVVVLLGALLWACSDGTPHTPTRSEKLAEAPTRQAETPDSQGQTPLAAAPQARDRTPLQQPAQTVMPPPSRDDHAPVLPAPRLERRRPLTVAPATKPALVARQAQSTSDNARAAVRAEPDRTQSRPKASREHEVQHAPAAVRERNPLLPAASRSTSLGRPGPRLSAPVAADRQMAAVPTRQEARVRLGSFASEAAARAEWARLAKVAPDLVVGRREQIVRYDRAGKAPLWLLRTGGFEGVAAARAFCARATEKGMSCLSAEL